MSSIYIYAYVQPDIHVVTDLILSGRVDHQTTLVRSDRECGGIIALRIEHTSDNYCEYTYITCLHTCLYTYVRAYTHTLTYLYLIHTYIYNAK